jgi:hypothetical protein
VLHLVKLSVGTRDIADLREWQAARAVSHPPLRHRTRNFPRRADEIADGGSLYWVIAGAVVVRQRICDVIEDKMEDGTSCAGIVLDPHLIPVLTRPMKPFQGWRYLSADEAPADIASRSADHGAEAMPPELATALRELCLID